ncbi:MAG: hypothetical protein V4501_11860 [Pseudomonadota bacterium]
MTKFFVIIGLLAGMNIIKLLLNKYKLKRLLFLEHQYIELMRQISEDQANPEQGFIENIPEVINLVEEAGQKSSFVSRVEPAGLGLARTIQLNLFDNMILNDEEVYTLMRLVFKQAIGVYKNRIRQCYNPIYWIEFLVFFPQNLIKYLAGNDNSGVLIMISRFLNALYWLLGFVCSIWFIYDKFK